MKRFFILIAAASVLCACAAGQVTVRPDAMHVQVGTSPPGQGFVQIGPITAKHGGGCGLYGSQGNYEGAMDILRNKAAERGVDYVQIVDQEGEHMAGMCLDRAYVIDGFAYKEITPTTK